MIFLYLLLAHESITGPTVQTYRTARTARSECSGEVAAGLGPGLLVAWDVRTARPVILGERQHTLSGCRRARPPVSSSVAFQRSKHVGGERAEGARQPLQRVRVGPEAGRHAGGPGDGRLLLPGEQDGDADPAVLLLLHPADELQQPTGHSLPICLPTIPVRPSLCVRTWSATAAAALSAATAAKKSAGQLCLDQGSEWC